MVRKWSYLATQPPTPHNILRVKLNARYTFKVFRTTTRFKKYRKDLTCFVRRKYAKRRHKTNWLEMGYITKQWVLGFFKSRQFIRFTQTLGLVNFNTYSTTSKLFNYISLNQDHTTNVGIISCSRAVLFFYKASKFLTNSPIRTENAMLTTTSSDILSDLTEFNSGLVNFDGLLYPYVNDNLKLNVTQTISLYQQLDVLTIQHTYKYLLFLYKMMTYLSIFNTFR